MKTLTLVALGVSTLSFSANAAENQLKVQKMDQSSYVQGPEDKFTGDAAFGSQFGNDLYKGAIVNFKAGAHTAWHTHPKGQTLVVTAGEGRARSEGGDIQVIKPGDTVWIPAGVKHWHGAAPDSPMTHIAIQAPDENGKVVDWMEKVSEEDYLGK